MKNKIPMTALILAGGKSSRMGCDKALLKIGDETILEALVRLTASVFSETFIIVSQAKNYQDLQLHKASLLNDFWENKGPLAGLYTGLSYSTHQTSCVLTCDMPLVNARLLCELAVYWRNDYDAVWPQDAEGKLQPFPAIYNRSCRHLIRLLLDRGETAMRRLSDILDIRPLVLDKRESRCLMNMNTRKDYEGILKSKQKEAIYEIPSSVAS